MTNSERYRRAFGHIRAPEGAAARAEAVQALPQVPARRRRPLRMIAVLAAVLALLVGAAGAELADGAVSNLLAPLYGGAQTELADRIGHPVGASATASGYTLTADAVIGDRHNIAVVFTLTRDDGEPIPKGLSFDDWESNAFDLSIFGSSGGGFGSSQADPERPDRMCIVYQWDLSSPILLHDFRLTARNLGVYDEQAQTFRVLAEGEWSLRFTLRFRDATVSVPVGGLSVTGTEGNVYGLQTLELSPISLHIDLTAPNAFYGLGPEDDTSDLHFMSDFGDVFLKLTDGTLVDLNHNFSKGGGGSSNKATVRGTYDTFFQTPVAPEDVEAVVVCGTEIPVSSD